MTTPPQEAAHVERRLADACAPSGSRAPRGTFTVVGADRAIHRERFDVSAGVLLWRDDGIAFLLQGAGPKVKATKLAAEVDR